MLVDRQSEKLAAWANRYEEALRAGLNEEESQEFADSDQDIGLLRTLVSLGCPPVYVARILL